MRYSRYVYLNQMCRSLQEAAEYMLAYPAASDIPILLGSCRELAAALSGSIQKDRASVKDPHIFELLEQVALLLATQPDSVPATEFWDLSQRLVHQIKGGIAYKIRAVFFAELGEKWDSMKSVYEAFLAREDCDPVIVRTPVFRVVSQNGRTRQDVIYKDFLTAAGIPSIGYQDYQIEKDCPDLAFTSQPYESCTLPAFWAENIAKHTRLVYLPYFTPHMLYADSVNTMCKMPIYQHAWRVIGSFQKHYQIYAENSPLKGSNMLVTGLPKWDETVSLKSNGLAPGERLPDWERLFEGRKVILWNSFYDFPSSSLHYFDGLCDYFARHQETALIWRPHPMTGTVTKLYYPPKLQDALKRIHETVERSDNMVLDTQTSYRPAFYYSHALISDFSSMMTQYLILDKPTLWLYHPTWTPTTALIRNHWMERANQAADIFAFLDRVNAGTDLNKELRAQVIREDIPLADGSCGARVAQLLLRQLDEENKML